MGCYLAPNDTSTIERVVEALGEGPKGAELMVAGDMNVNLAEPEDDRRDEDIAATLATEGLEDMAAHFLPQRRCWCRDRSMWSILRKGGRCGPRQIISWGRIAVSLGMSPSETLGTTQNITWCWVACQEPPWRSTSGTSGAGKSYC